MPDNNNFKYAELPNGKMLKFPQATSDKDIRRAVRHELGLTNQDMLEAFELLTERMTDILGHAGKQAERDRQIIDQVADAFQGNANRIAGEVSDAVKSLAAGLEVLKTDLHKTMANQANLVIKLTVAIESLNNTLDAALGQSLASMDEGHAITSRGATGMERGLRELAGLVTAMNAALGEMGNVKKLRRRAVRNRDGSYTFETT